MTRCLFLTRLTSPVALAVALAAAYPQSASAQSCDTNRLETLRKRFERLAGGSRCLRLVPSLSALSVRAQCYVKTPPPQKLMDDLQAVQDEYGGIAQTCDDRFRQTWVGFLERMGLSCDVFSARSSFGDALEHDQLPQRITRAGVQCLSDNPETRGKHRGELVGYVRDLVSEATPQSWPQLRRDLLIAMLDSFAFVGVNAASPNSSISAIATAIQADQTVSTDEWPFFLARVADQFEAERTKFVPNPSNVVITSNQLILASRLLRTR
jgi:hypothetical protein